LPRVNAKRRGAAMRARIRALSGIGAKGPAAFLLEAGGRRLLLDLGRGPDPGAEPALDGLGTVDAVVLSHGHGDHVGALDRLGEIGDPPVWATAPVLRGLGIADDARATLPLAGSVAIAGIVFTTGRSGHAPGGVWLHAAIAGGLLYCGDLCPDAPLYAYDPPPAAATVILDAAYGLDATPRGPREAALAAFLDRPRLVLPAPADGRGPELALWAMAATGQAPALCAATRAAVRALLGPAVASLRPERRASLERLLAKAPEPSTPWRIAVAAGATLDAGPAAALAARGDATILLTGHVPPGSRADVLLATGRAERRRWPVHPTLPQNQAIVAATGARLVIPAFDAEATAEAWRGALPGSAITLDSAVELAHWS
jgi:glyoxylase-like metal-dependent hydrolase (beta-lactamase superfamily II)